MKQIIATLHIDENKFIEVYYPDIENKFNYYYKPSEKLHKFDEIMITLNINNDSVLIYNDMLEEFPNVYRQIRRAKDQLLDVPVSLVGNMVHSLNESNKTYVKKKYRDINFSNYWVLSTSTINGGVQTFMYTFENKIYLEVGQLYKWHHTLKKKTNTDYIPIEKFIKDYKPILFQEISIKTVENWTAICDPILKEIERNHAITLFDHFEPTVMYEA